MDRSMESQHEYMKTVASILAARGVDDAGPIAEQYTGWKSVFADEQELRSDTEQS